MKYLSQGSDFRIWKHQDTKCPPRISLYVCVDLWDDPENVNVHLFHSHRDCYPVDPPEFLVIAQREQIYQVCLSAADLPALLREIRQAARELKKVTK